VIGGLAVDRRVGHDGAVPAQLAQVNLARLRFGPDSARMREFVEAVARINRLADSSAGFVWRYGTSDAHLSVAEETGDPLMIINLSVWESYEHLHAYVYRSAHGHYVRRRYEWFEKIPGPATALWWVPAGHRPTPAEALARLRHLRTYGPTPRAFTVRRRFAPTGEVLAPRNRYRSN
jgi:Domain of unknown function (DUF3291)